MTVTAHRITPARQVTSLMQRRLRRILITLLLLSAAGVGTALGLFVTPYLVPILGALALLVLVAIIVNQTARLLRDEDPQVDTNSESDLNIGLQ